MLHDIQTAKPEAAVEPSGAKAAQPKITAAAG